MIPTLSPSYYFPPTTRRPTYWPSFRPTKIPTLIPAEIPSPNSSEPQIIIKSQSVPPFEPNNMIVIISLCCFIFVLSILLGYLAYDRCDRRRRTLNFLKWNTIQNKNNDILILSDQFQRQRYDSEEGEDKKSIN